MAFNPNPEQRRAIEAKGSVLVSAAAGSGKTAVLTQRVLRILLDPENPVDADRLAVVTFTKAAAAEMKQRIGAGLAGRLRENPSDPLAQRQKALLSGAAVCTLDSLCLQLVREYFHRLGIAPDFRPAEPGSLRILEQTALDEVLDAAFEESEPRFLRLTEMLGADRFENNLGGAVRTVDEYLRSLPFPDEWMNRVLEMYRRPFEETPWAEELRSEMRELLEEMRYRLSAAEPVFAREGFDKLKEKALILQAEIETLREALETGLREFADALRRAEWSDFPVIRPKFETESSRIRKTTNDALKKFKNTLSRRFSKSYEEKTAEIRELLPSVECLFDLVRAYRRRLDELKNERGVYDFADIESKALQLLVRKNGDRLEYTEIARSLSERYAQVLVDEYQDVNDLQDTILTALSDGGRRLFMVGDVKQSIYGFRKANPENFLKRYLHYPLFDEEQSRPESKILLNRNYRSRSGICDFVNFVFGLLMSREAGDLDYTKDERLVPGAQFPDREGADVELCLLDAAGSAEENAVAEGRWIAERILELCRDEKAVSDPAAPGGMRPARFSDIAILLRSGKVKEILAAELAKKGIPVAVQVEKGFLRAEEVDTVLCFLRAVDNPLREIPLLGALHSPLFGFTAERLAEIRCEAPGNFYHALRKAAENGAEDCLAFLDRLDFFRKLAVALPAHKLIRRVYDETGYFVTVQAMPQGARRRANLLLLADYAQNFENSDFKGLSAFLRYLDRLDPEDSGLRCAGAAEGNAVQIMTVHNSKGLQFPVCILANCSGKFNTAELNGGMILDEKLGIGLKAVDDARRVRYETWGFHAVKNARRRALLSEEMRVLYVAMTRAEERLLLFVTGKKGNSDYFSQLTADFSGTEDKIPPRTVLKAGSFSDWILAAALLHPKGGPLRSAFGSDANPVPWEGNLQIRFAAAEQFSEGTAAADEAAPPPLPDPETEAALEARLSYRYPYEALKGIASKRAASRLRADEQNNEFAFTARPAFLSDGAATPAERGIAVHAFMEAADYARAEANLEEEIARLTVGGFISRRGAELIDREKVRAFFASELYGRMKRADRLWREHRFLTAVELRELEAEVPDEAACEEILVQGSADCVFEEAGSLVIVDYKTDRSKDENQLIEHYGPQLRLYAKAARKTLGKPVKELLLYSFELRRTLKVPDEGDFA